MYMVYSQIIKENIDYESLLLAHPYDQEMVEEIYDLILETVLSKNEESVFHDICKKFKNTTD